MQFTNHSVNFFRYVISGHKFRTDLKDLFMIFKICELHSTLGTPLNQEVEDQYQLLVKQ